MPIYIPERKIKIKCQKCGKVVTFKVGGYGDCITDPLELAKIARDMSQKYCPRCGSRLNIDPI